PVFGEDYILRSVLADLHSKKIIDFRTANILTNVKTRSDKKLPSHYTPEEVMCIEKSIDRKYAIGKRDYAIILLATRLGLRSSDIRLLQFSNIDWENNVIILEQFKTKEPIELPLLVDVGEAIIDYIKYGRPKSFSKYIFLKGNSPHLPLGGQALTAITKKYFIKSNVKFAKKRHGPHSLRHSLATNLLKKGTPLPVISGTLGHSSTANTMIYVHLNTEDLLKCSLDVPPVSKDFYLQIN
ncbi:site-specific integrase, partial [Chryseobacterium carnipullorum]|uniref:site-specific integrase n=1 Tax=Chryseobacterium carnipullorum TaxID=1124835 RepID=UPI000E87A2DF